jgi:hypothetical protein
MATITLAAGANTRSWTISNADLQRLLDAVKRDSGKVTNPDGTLRDLTNTECFNIVANRFANNISDQIKGSERAAAPIPPVGLVEIP